MKSILRMFVQHRVFANLLLLMIFAAGGLSTVTMVKRVLPPFELDIIQVVVPFPGAGPEEVEEGIIQRLEEALEGIDGIKKITTVASENMASAMIELQTGEDLQAVKDKVSDRVNAQRQFFPADAETPSVTEFELLEDTTRITLTGGLSERQMKELAEDMKDDLLKLPEISRVEIKGTRDYEISIEVSEEQLRKYGLTFDDVSRAVRQASLNLPGGRLRSDNEQVNIRTMGRLYHGRQYEDIVLISDQGGTAIRVGDVATVRDGFVEDQVITRYNGERAVSIYIFNASDDDALAISAAVERYVEEKRAELPPTVSLSTWGDTSILVRDRMDLLTRNGIVGLTLVFLLLWIFLDLRLAIWVSLGIPISLAGALALMLPLGQSLNMISMFAMIMVLGIVVDDAIVVGEAIYVQRKSGKAPVDAAVDGTIEVAWPVIAAVITSCVAFFPLLFVQGIMGKFIAVIPIVVISALLISLVEGLIILPAHLNNLPEMNNGDPALEKRGWGVFGLLGMFRSRFSHRMEVWVESYYRPFLAWALSWRYASLAMMIAVFLVTLGLLRGGFVKFVFFPDPDTDYLIANIEFPEGTPLETTEQAIAQLEEGIRQVEARTNTRTGQPMIKAIESSVGSQLAMDGSGTSSGSHMGQMFVELLGSESRDVNFRQIVTEWREAAGIIAGAQSVAIEGATGGPPGKAIDLWLLGEDLDMLSAAAEDARSRLATYAGVFQIEDDFRPGKREIRAQIRPEAHSLGLNTEVLARQLRQGFFGDEVVRVQRGRDEVKVWVRYPIGQRRSLADVESIRVRTPSGDEVPLLSVADVSLEQGYTTIRRVDGLRRISVSADVDDAAANTSEVIAKFQGEDLPELLAAYPGIRATFEGEQAENRESFGSLVVGFPLAVLGIYLIIATIFRSYIQPVVIMITVPFGVIGALWGHLFLGYSLTIMSAFGMVALTGVVVNDAIVMIEAFNTRVASGMKFLDALLNAGVRRFRPITLTTATTVGGLTPLIMERSMQAQFLIPMALTLAAGVAFATVLTLVLIPCLIYILNDLRRFGLFVRTGKWCTPEEAEPASKREAPSIDPHEMALPGAAPKMPLPS